MRIRPLESDDLPVLLALNNAHAAEVNALTEDAFRRHMTVAAYAVCVDGGLGFLLAFDETTPVQGPNHGWFVERFARFAYVDRVVVAAEARGQGIARRFYERLVEAGRPLCCEVNVEPLNAVSLAFHERLGFVPCGEAIDPRNGKRVRYLVRH